MNPDDDTQVTDLDATTVDVTTEPAAVDPAVMIQADDHPAAPAARLAQSVEPQALGWGVAGTVRTHAADAAGKAIAVAEKEAEKLAAKTTKRSGTNRGEKE
jgi:hypothetical protein